MRSRSSSACSGCWRLKQPKSSFGSRRLPLAKGPAHEQHFEKQHARNWERGRDGASFEDFTLAHAFSWLLAGNAIGLWMSAMLLFPPLGDLVGRLSYGRWAAVHIDLQMYGWCSLPLLALLFHLYSPPQGHGRLGLLGDPLLVGARWPSSPSLRSPAIRAVRFFVEWSGAARWVFGFALVFTSVAVIAAYVRRFALWRRGDLAESRLAMLGKGLGLLALLPAPIAMVMAASPSLYPPINPESGGSTSTNTLASVLGVGLLLALFPFLAGLRPRDGGRFSWLVFGLFGLHFLFLSRLGPGDHSHREPLQLLALYSALIWLPLLWEHLRRFPWPAVAGSGFMPWAAGVSCWPSPGWWQAFPAWPNASNTPIPWSAMSMPRPLASSPLGSSFC